MFLKEHARTSLYVKKKHDFQKILIQTFLLHINKKNKNYILIYQFYAEIIVANALFTLIKSVTWNLW